MRLHQNSVSIEIEITPKGDGNGISKSRGLSEFMIEIEITPKGDGNDIYRKIVEGGAEIEIEITPKGDGNTHSISLTVFGKTLK